MTCAAALVLALTVTARPARADAGVQAALDDARRDKAALRYAAALATVERALAMGHSDPDELAALYRLAGELAAGLDDPARATESFMALLALTPGAALPAGTSPKLATPFAAARTELAGRALAVRFRRASGNRVVIVVDVDPVRAVAGARLRVHGHDGVVRAIDRAGASPFTLTVPAGSALDSASVLDRHGNQLVVHDGGPSALPGPPVPEPPVEGGTPLYARWWLWGGTAAVLGGVGLLFVDRMQAAEDDFAALRADSAAHDFAEADAVRARGERHALLANLSFVAAGVAGTAALVLLVRDLGAPRRERPRSTLAPSAGPGSLGLSYQRSF